MIKEVDLMEYASDVAAQAAYVTNGTRIRSNADVADEDMSDISSWTDSDGGTGESSQVTFDGNSCMKLTNGGSAGGANYAYRIKDIGIFGARSVFSIRIYFDAIGTMANADDFFIAFFNGSYQLQVRFCSDGIYIHNGTSPQEVGTDLVVQDVWQEWTFDVDWTARTVDVRLDGVLKASGVSIDYASATANGTILLIQYGTTTTDRISYIDWLKAGSDTTTLNYLQSYSEGTIKVEGSYSLKGVATTEALNKTLTRTIGSPLDLTGITQLRFWMRSSRTGSNIKIGLHDSGGTTTEITPNISSANTWQECLIDLSAVVDADKNAIDSIIITIVNADANNTFYIDNFYARKTRPVLIL